MTNDQLVNLLTVGAVPVFIALLGFAYNLMVRSDKRRDAEAAEEKAQLDAAKQTQRRYLQLREQFASVRDRCLRRLHLTLTRLENGKNTEAAAGVKEAITELEQLELPPLE